MTAPCLLLAGGGTGGHVFPMVAVADALLRLVPALRVVFVGTARGMETKVVPSRGYELELLDVLPIRGGGAWGALRGVGRAAATLPAARSLVRRLAARAVFSIGGYAAGPVSLAARVSGVPVALMEPNAAMGLANRLIAPIVQRGYTAFPEAERHFAPRVVLRSGVPIRSGFEARRYAREPGRLRVLVLGGSQGARTLNERLPSALARTGVDVEVVHQTGAAEVEAVTRSYAQCGLAECARVVGFIEDMPAALGAADLVLGRSGASAVSEICSVGRPSVLVPYPHASGDHQRLNALSLEGDGAAVCLPQERADVDALAATVRELATTPGRLEQMAERARARGRPDAADIIAKDLLTLAGLGEAVQTAGGASGPVDDTSGVLRLREAV